jgi:hypothetical protein
VGAGSPAALALTERIFRLLLALSLVVLPVPREGPSAEPDPSVSGLHPLALSTSGNSEWG